MVRHQREGHLPFGLNANAEEEGLPEGAGPLALQGELEASSGAAGGAASDKPERATRNNHIKQSTTCS